MLLLTFIMSIIPTILSMFNLLREQAFMYRYLCPPCRPHPRAISAFILQALQILSFLQPAFLQLNSLPSFFQKPALVLEEFISCAGLQSGMCSGG